MGFSDSPSIFKDFWFGGLRCSCHYYDYGNCRSGLTRGALSQAPKPSHSSDESLYRHVDRPPSIRGDSIAIGKSSVQRRGSAARPSSCLVRLTGRRRHCDRNARFRPMRRFGELDQFGVEVSSSASNHARDRLKILPVPPIPLPGLPRFRNGLRSGGMDAARCAVLAADSAPFRIASAGPSPVPGPPICMVWASGQQFPVERPRSMRVNWHCRNGGGGGG